VKKHLESPGKLADAEADERELETSPVHPEMTAEIVAGRSRTKES
jgi:hypothetical protein